MLVYMLLLVFPAFLVELFWGMNFLNVRDWIRFHKKPIAILWLVLAYLCDLIAATLVLEQKEQSSGAFILAFVFFMFSTLLALPAYGYTAERLGPLMKTVEIGEGQYMAVDILASGRKKRKKEIVVSSHNDELADGTILETYEDGGEEPKGNTATI